MRAKDALFTVPKPLANLGIGVDALPEEQIEQGSYG